jgi:hypothetical protein
MLVASAWLPTQGCALIAKKAALDAASGQRRLGGGNDWRVPRGTPVLAVVCVLLRKVRGESLSLSVFVPLTEPPPRAGGDVGRRFVTLKHASRA